VDGWVGVALELAFFFFKGTKRRAENRDNAAAVNNNCEAERERERDHCTSHLKGRDDDTFSPYPYPTPNPNIRKEEKPLKRTKTRRRDFFHIRKNEEATTLFHI
jgi:hypothetical protein